MNNFGKTGSEADGKSKVKNIAILEDEKPSIDVLLKYLKQFEKEKNETFNVVYYMDANSFLANYNANLDIIFLDIQLPDMNGMEVAKKIRSLDESVILIFVTNMAQFAVGGYAVDAMDFMVKPVSYENLCLKVARAIKRLDSRKDEKLVIWGKNGATVVKIPEVRYIEVLNHKLTFHTTHGPVPATGSLNKIEEKVAPFMFSRCNNCYLVNLNYVTKVEDFTVWLGKDVLTISRARKRPFLEDIADFLGGSV